MLPASQYYVCYYLIIVEYIFLSFRAIAKTVLLCLTYVSYFSLFRATFGVKRRAVFGMMLVHFRVKLTTWWPIHLNL